jgi:hypothetical protein
MEKLYINMRAIFQGKVEVQCLFKVILKTTIKIKENTSYMSKIRKSMA